MNYYTTITMIFIAVIIYVIYKNFIENPNKKNRNNSVNKNIRLEEINTEPEETYKFEYANAYKQKWLFTYNEKEAFYKIKRITDELNLLLFAKVRLFDLIEPRDTRNKAYQYKIQAKHVDFVICNKNLIAKIIIELDDSSHNSKERKERDKFVDMVLKDCGYKVLRYRYINSEELKKVLLSITENPTSV